MSVHLPGAGAWVSNELVEEGEPFTTADPAHGTVICELPASPEAVVEAAVASARDAF